MICLAGTESRETTRRMGHAMAAVAWFLVGHTVSAALPAKVRFNEHIRPLLSERCFACHGPDEKQRTAKLRLDTRAGATHDLGGRAAVVPGKPEESELLIRVTEEDPAAVMPPPKAKKPRLTADEVALLRKWIEQGAEYEGHWAFLPLRNEPPPDVKDQAWVRNPLDRFVLSRLEQEGIRTSPEADRATLIRRVSLDLIGLLPSPEEVEQFANDAQPQAYEELVERLLASPHYGERWGRHWLDQARYADSNGYANDGDREMWPYRDWVIQSLNDDLPFDRFTIEQLAGDLLPNPTKSQLVATAYHRNTLINAEGGTDREQFRVESVLDRVNTTGAVWLGLTVGCAQCHTHKFDPISQREYYELMAFFNSTEDANDRGPTVEVVRGEIFGNPITLPPPETPPLAGAELAKRGAEWESETRARLEKLATVPPPPKHSADALLLAALQTAAEQRTAAQKRLVQDAFERAEPRARPPVKKANPNVAQLMIMRDLPQPRDTFLLTRGDFTRPDKTFGALAAGVLKAVPPELPKSDQNEQRPTRLDLARWLVHRDNPLTPRVTMNRIWMRYFGRGLVETDEDFGAQGVPPTHPALLDWLAAEFSGGTPGAGQGAKGDGGDPASENPKSEIRNPKSAWSLKRMHRLIVTSATYRQSSQPRADLLEKDPRNLLLARQERLRFDAEITRDAALCASGLLERMLGGPSVHPPQPDGVYAFTSSARSWDTATGSNRYRRAMYTFFKRSAPYPLFTTFDAPDFQAVCTRRLRSNTPLQSLTLANDAAFIEMAQGLALRLAREVPGDGRQQLDARIRRAGLLCLSRPPSPRELTLLRDYFLRQWDGFSKDGSAAEKLASADLSRTVSKPEAAALVCLARAVLNSDNFIMRE